MKKAVVWSLIVGTLLSGGAGAMETFGEGQGAQRWQGAREQEMAGEAHQQVGVTGAAIGALAGALMAGPPGFIVGAAGGVLVERNGGLEADLHSLRQEVSALQQQEFRYRQTVRELRRQAREQANTRQRELRAVADAFVYSIRFRSDQAQPEAADVSELQRLATVLKQIESLRLTLHAHADGRGTDAYNRQLSEARAAVVKELLVAAGLAPGRIRCVAQGESGARYPLNDREGLGFDRRVEIRLDYGERQ
ncbi:MAG: OmpA family protein [Sedimenticola sp.]|nr:OmpA family protein [Sedimenticola sp.]